MCVSAPIYLAATRRLGVEQGVDARTGESRRSLQDERMPPEDSKRTDDDERSSHGGLR
jgi:hypothetical protein